MSHPFNNQTSDKVFLDRYQSLNTAQRHAVDTIDGPVLVVAGPGSGKTELLGMRVANILRQTDTLPSSILCLTFTDSAAVNMQKRLESLIGNESYHVAIHTFHSFGSEIIAEHPEYFYKGARYSPADEITQLKILQAIFETLPHDNSLGSFHPEYGFTYIKDARSRISELKKNGLTPGEFRTLLKANKQFLSESAALIAETFDGRVDKTIFDKINNLLLYLSEIKLSPSAGAMKIATLKDTIMSSLQVAYDLAQDGDKISTKPITEWKQKFTKKNDQKKTVLKDLERLQRNFDLADVYEQYIQRLQHDGLYDYDDMLLDVVKVLQTKPDLRYTLQEKYLYVLVDEFQDTNGVQMRLLDLLLDSELNEGRPNIMAVGDDDQAIYKFQGANIENILGFHQRFRDPVVVVLTQNYRSTQKILDFARKVVLKGEDRLENRLAGSIQKELVAAREHLPEGLLQEQLFDTSFEELFWIAKTIQQMIKDGRCKPSEIALLSPVHRILEQAAKVLNYFGIPVAYERKQNLLEEKYISQIITILEFIDSMQQKDDVQADYLLPKILSFEFWGLNRIALWRLASNASRSRKNWIESMLQSDSKYIQSLAKFFISLAYEAEEKTAEEIIDLITGVKPSLLPDDGDDDGVDQSSLNLEEKEAFLSPFKQYYFGSENFQHHQNIYLEHLQNLQAFISKIRHYSAGGTLYVHDVIEFVRLLKANRLPLNHTLELSTNNDAVRLLTVHKAKGLEFDSVFVLHCQDETWVTRRSEKLQFMSNLAFSPESQTSDDVLRLFYVAVTRAKHHLYLTGHRYDDKGKELMHLRFLPENSNISDHHTQGVVNIEEMKVKFAHEQGAQNFFELQNEVRRHEVLSEDEKHLLKSLLQNYRLSVTHLTNFLNVVEAGPQIFLEQNLLRFPQAISPAAGFGSAMHEALANFYHQYKSSSSLPSLEFLQKQYEAALRAQRFNAKVFKQKLEKGRSDLMVIYEKRKDFFDPGDRVEVNFASQQVVVNGATLSGKIDRIHIDPERHEVVVIDYKTGKPFATWDPMDSSLQLKAWKYRLQLVFYKLLVEHSREFRGRGMRVRTGMLEFLQPQNGDVTSIGVEIPEQEVLQLQKLIGIVYRKILALDFPDISKYDKDMFGIGCFVNDLLEERI